MICSVAYRRVFVVSVYKKAKYTSANSIAVGGSCLPDTGKYKKNKKKFDHNKHVRGKQQPLWDE